MIIAETGIFDCYSILSVVRLCKNNSQSITNTLQLVTLILPDLKYLLLGSLGLSVVIPGFARFVHDIDLVVDIVEKPVLDKFFRDQGFASKSSLAGKFPFSRIIGKLLRNRYVRYYPNNNDSRGILPVEILYTPKMFNDNEVRLSPLPIVTAVVPNKYLCPTIYGLAIQPAALYRLRRVFDAFVDPIIGKNPKVVADMNVLKMYIDPLEYLRSSRDIVFRIGLFSFSKRLVKPNYHFPR